MTREKENERIAEIILGGETCLAEISRIMGNDRHKDYNAFKRVTKRASRILKRLKQPTFEKALEENNHLPYDNWSHGWLKTENSSIFIKNQAGQIDLDEVISDLFDKHISNLNLSPFEPSKAAYCEVFDRLVISDVHIGMEPDKNGTSMYPMKWGVSEIEAAKQSIIKTVLSKKEGNVLYFDNLGDYLDGYEGKTTRGGHSLEQNMSTAEMFTLGVDWMMELIEVFCNVYENVVVNNITNDNHSGTFAEICGISIQKLVQLKYPNVIFMNQRKFIDHYSVGKHTFLLCHGKDKSLMKYGFGSVPNKDHMNKIENYISAHKLNTAENTNIEFSKGDSHLYNADNGSSDIFSYISYPTLAPNSEWITTNFKKDKRGFVFHNIEAQTSNKSIYPIYL